MARRSESQPSLEDWWSEPTPTVRAAPPTSAPAISVASAGTSVASGAQPSLLDEGQGGSAGRPEQTPDDPVTLTSGDAAPSGRAQVDAAPVLDVGTTVREAAHSTGMTPASRFAVTSDSVMAPSGAKARIEANLAALRALRVITEEGRGATPGEQEILAKWGGWGAQGLSQIFDADRPEFDAQRAELHALLSDGEFDAARRTTINAHYTSPSIVVEMWAGLESLGFAGGSVLEPGCGSGTFIGAAPRGVSMVGVELDPITAGIAALLYPDADIRAESFASTRFPSGHFDAVIGNVPFADTVLHDPRYNPQKLTMHNHFIVKSLEMTRPGGMVAVLTSRYTMDAANPAARREMYARADLVAAVRLPTGAHRRTAGTDAVTDLLILRRREAAPRRDEPSWVRTLTLDVPNRQGGEEPTRLNEYWLDHPSHVLGRQHIDVGLHGIPSLEVAGDPATAPEQLRHVLQQAAEEARLHGLTMTPRTPQEHLAAGYVPAPSDEIDGLLVATPDGFARVQDGLLVPAKVFKSDADEVRALIAMRDQVRLLISMEAASLDDTPALDVLRSELAANWESYTARYGPINRAHITQTKKIDEETGDPIVNRRTPSAVAHFRNDPYGPLLWGIEVFDDGTQTAKPATLLRERVILPRQPVLGVDNAQDGLAVVLDTHGRVDLDEIARLEGVSRDEVIAELGDGIYIDPVSDQWVTRAEYCSGNVREKYEQALAAARADSAGEWQRNVDALAAVVPADLQPGEITPRIGAVWIPASDHEAFLQHILGSRGPAVTNVPGIGWTVERADYGIRATGEWGTERMPAGKIMHHLLEQRAIIVTDPIEPGSAQRIFNPVATEAAVEKANVMAERFQDWVWEDPARAARLAADYNRRFNSTVLRDFTAEGEALTFPGLTKTFQPYPHQRTAVARMIHSPSVGLFHEVGAGKTAEMAIGAMELKRLGLINKPAVVVPNHMLEQFSREWAQLYPQARLLAASSDHLQADKRRAFVASVAANDWDAVILTRTAFERLSLLPENERAFQDREMSEARERLDNIKATGNRASVKAQERQIQRAEERLKAIRDVPSDPGLHFEQTGIDYLVVDELHHYKNLRTTSAIPGAQIIGSQRAMDLFAKVDWLRQGHGNRVITGATATPIANSVTEMWVMQRYLDPEGLEKAGLHSFDEWAATFGEVTTDFELNVAGKLKLKSRFARFNNLPELRTMFASFGDVKTAAELTHLRRPQIAMRADGRRDPRLVVVPPSPELKDYLAKITERVDRIAARQVRPDEDNMLKVSSDGRKAALDLRLIDPNYGAIDGGKIQAAADELHRVWLKTRDNVYNIKGDPSPTPGGLQIVFCDLGTPSTEWNVYDELKQQLVARGMPAASIRFIHEAKTDAAKARLFAACRTGDVSVLIGSTEKMGVGTNIQDRAVHLMDLDAPWRPADVTQRHGRIIRNGNQNPEVEITQVVAEGTFDAFMWQLLEVKARFIDQVMGGHDLARQMEGDVGQDVFNFAEAKAVLSGNPLLLEEATAQKDLQRFRRLERAHEQSQRSLVFQRDSAIETLDRASVALPVLAEAAERTVPTAGDEFRLATPRATISTRADATAYLERAIRDYAPCPRTIGTLGGHPIVLAQKAGMPDGQIRLVWELGDVEGVQISTTVASLYGEADRGLITRLENMSQNGIPALTARLTTSAEEAKTTLTNAEALIGKPFPHAGALEQAQERYTTVQTQLALQHQQELIPETAAPTETAAPAKTAAQQAADRIRATGPGKAPNPVDAPPPVIRQQPPGLRR